MDAAVEAWKFWRDERVLNARAPYGPLSLTGTYWLDELRPNSRALPGRWSVVPRSGQAVRAAAVALTAARHDGVTVDDVPLDGTVRLHPADGAEGPDAPRIGHGGRRLELIVREGRHAVRVFDPASRARSGFAGIDAFPYDPDWVLPAQFAPFAADRTVRVPHSDGRKRPTVLAGTLTFSRGSTGCRVEVRRAADGALTVSLVDATRTAQERGFRVVEIPAPDGTGTTLVDFNRAQLPPSAFAEHYLCPLPSAGNTLPFPVRAGERRLLERA
ncbi:DUF1684 domain-containing protein [Streptacidiphilus melanogenes]|uniref:DUF1684 domain-containing protein n=1 Tax=Streptacidiphilus melanogenes TaxID=411235 RepID=UPI000694CCE4|nr:DUF1684 domain-containing protein [Streptacidiphilus melanogenes]